jgi:hypothetical protein
MAGILSKTLFKQFVSRLIEKAKKLNSLCVLNNVINPYLSLRASAANAVKKSLKSTSE